MIMMLIYIMVSSSGLGLDRWLSKQEVMGSNLRKGHWWC